MLKRRVPPLPRPHRQLRVAERMVSPAALGSFVRLGKAQGVTDPTTRLYIGVAAAMLVCWLVASRAETASSGHQR